MRHLIQCLALCIICGLPSASPADTGHLPLERPDDPPAQPGGIRDAPKTVADIEVNGFRSVQVNVDDNGANIPGDAANEPSIAVDPTAPNRLVVGWRQFDSITSNFREAGLGISLDGGRTWTFPGVLDDGVFRSDPILATDRSGRLFYNSLAVPGDSIVTDYFLSDDGGASWTSPIPAFGGDKAWTTVDTTGGIGDGHVYQSWANAGNPWGERVFTRSVDGGLTWSDPLALVPAPTWGSMVVASDGTLYIAGNANYERSVAVVWRSMDAQDPSLEQPTFDLFAASFGGYQGTTGNPNLGPNPQGLLGQVWIDVDRSGGPRHGTLYMVCSVDPTGPDPQDVRLVRSEDNGETWSLPITIHDDDRNAWQWFGTMSVAPDGRLDVVWIESTSETPSNVGRLMVSQSFDGGATWSPALAASPEFDSHVGWPNQQKMGDYFHMRSDLVGADLIYAATFNGEQDVYYLRIGDRDCNGNGIGDTDDLAEGRLRDCDRNEIPDSCDIAARPGIDEDGDGIPDACTAPREIPGRAGG
jgi:hypothetical protein